MKTLTAKGALMNYLKLPYEQVRRMGNKQMFEMLKSNGYYFSNKTHLWLPKVSKS